MIFEYRRNEIIKIASKLIVEENLFKNVIKHFHPLNPHFKLIKK